MKIVQFIIFLATKHTVKRRVIPKVTLTIINIKLDLK